MSAPSHVPFCHRQASGELASPIGSALFNIIIRCLLRTVSDVELSKLSWADGRLTWPGGDLLVERGEELQADGDGDGLLRVQGVRPWTGQVNMAHGGSRPPIHMHIL